MPEDDSWDWPVIMYVATVILKRPEREFWRMTPRKFKALTDAHVEMNTPPDEKNKMQGTKDPRKNVRRGYIDQIVF
ncbi:hypothetical protein D3C79_972270 [compost metagenome]